MSVAKRKVVVVGGGLAGLSAAVHLAMLPQCSEALDITLVEATQRLGGMVHTSPSHCGRFLFERGPHSFRSVGPGVYTVDLALKLGLRGRLTAGTREAKKRFIYYNGRVRTVTLALGLWIVGLRGIVKDLSCWFRKAPVEEETIDQFATRHFGNTTAKVLFSAIVSGIFAGNIEELSMPAAFPAIFDLQARHGSLIVAGIRSLFSRTVYPGDVSKEAVDVVKASSVYSFSGGMQDLVDGMVGYLQRAGAEGPAVTIRTGVTVEAIEKHRSNGYRLRMKDVASGDAVCTVDADSVVVACPAFAVAPMLVPAPESASKNAKEVAQLLNDIPYAPIRVLCWGFHALGHTQSLFRYAGFGFLVPRCYGIKTLGMIFDSCAFPEQQLLFRRTASLDVTVGTVMTKDTETPAAQLVTETLRMSGNTYSINDPDIGGTALEECMTIEESRWHRAIPQFTIGHTQRTTRLLALMGEEFPNVHLCGNYLHGIAVNDAVNTGRRAAQIVAASLA